VARALQHRLQLQLGGFRRLGERQGQRAGLHLQVFQAQAVRRPAHRCVEQLDHRAVQRQVLQLQAVAGRRAIPRGAAAGRRRQQRRQQADAAVGAALQRQVATAHLQ
jgi:hypothetical protein